MYEEIKFWFKFFKLWVANILVALDQLAAALIGYDPDETLSSILGKGRDRGNKWATPLANFLDYLDDRHTTKYKEEDEGNHSVWLLWKQKYKKKKEE